MSANRINITLNDYALSAIDIIAERDGISRSEAIANMIMELYRTEELFGRVSYRDLHDRVDLLFDSKYRKK